MSETKKLEMVFHTATEGKKAKVVVENPKDDLTEETVRTAMTAIIDKNVFVSSSGDLTSIAYAQVITTGKTSLIAKA